MQSIASTHPVTAPWVWSSAELAARSDWIVEFDPQARADLDAALVSVKRSALPVEQITAREFPLPSLSDRLEGVRRMLGHGLGLCLLRGLPVDRYSQEDLGLLLWGIGTHLGRGVSQSYRGDVIGEVMDMTHTGDARRAYRSPRPLDLHVDLVDVVGLLCVRRARSGGASLVASSIAIHNAILAERPDLLAALYRGFYYRHSEASSTGEPPTSDHRVPVFGMAGDQLVCNFNSSPVSRSFREDPHIQNDAATLEAFDYFIRTAARDDILYRMMLEPGDIQLLNNRLTLHGRDEFEDYPGLDRKRLMLRVWLMMAGWAPLPDEMRPRKTEGGIPRTAAVA